VFRHTVMKEHESTGALYPFGIHTAGVCVTGRSVAKSSPSLQVFLCGRWLGDTNPTPVSISLRIAASAKPSTGGFRHRTLSCFSFQGQGYLEHSSWESRSSPGNKRQTISNEVV